MQPLKTALNTLSWTGLALTLIPSLFFLAGKAGGGTVNLLMVVGMVLWFGARVWRESAFPPTQVSEPAVEPDPPHTL